MPYYVFKIAPDRKLTFMATYTKYSEAKKVCRELRQTQARNDPSTVRMAFAANERDARRLLLEKHNLSSPLEEWEA